MIVQASYVSFVMAWGESLEKGLLAEDAGCFFWGRGDWFYLVSEL
jgi:hypothetical protein